MGIHCPLCGGEGGEEIFSLGKSPVFQMISQGTETSAEYFRPLEVIKCGSCGHLYNSLFKSSDPGFIYDNDYLTNQPISARMSGKLGKVGEFISSDVFSGKHIVEIGGGGGFFAKVLAPTAKSVVMFEPSRAVSDETFKGSNIQLVNELFDPCKLEQKADLFIARHVMEHIPDVAMVMRAIYSGLSDSGYAYFEVPDLEFIVQTGLPYEFHYGHVHYFSRAALRKLLAETGFAVVREIRLTLGHDYGVLVKKGLSSNFVDEPPFSAMELRIRVANEKLAHGMRLGKCRGRIGIYGVNSQSNQIYNVHADELGTRAVVYDDNAAFSGWQLYNPTTKANICSEISALLDCESVLIAAYLHSRDIVERLHAAGYRGEILDFCDTQELPGI